MRVPLASSLDRPRPAPALTVPAVPWPRGFRACGVPPRLRGRRV